MYHSVHPCLLILRMSFRASIVIQSARSRAKNLKTQIVIKNPRCHSKHNVIQNSHVIQSVRSKAKNLKTHIVIKNAHCHSERAQQSEEPQNPNCHSKRPCHSERAQQSEEPQNPNCHQKRPCHSERAEQSVEPQKLTK